MSLTLVVGRPNAGKTGVLHDAIRRSVAVGQTPVLLLPTRPDVHAASREFAQRGPGIGVSVMVFDDYVDDLWRLHGDRRGIVGSAERALLLSGAIRRTRLDALAESAHGPGLSRLLAPIAANTFQDIPSPPPVRTVAGDVLRILCEYGEMLREVDLIERASAVRLLEGLMAKDWFGGPVVANRFADLTSVQERLLVAAVAYTEVWLSLPWDEDFPATRALTPLVTRLCGAGGRLWEQLPGDFTRSEELRYIESRLFMAPGVAIGAPRRGDVRLSRAYGEDAEAGRIAAEVQAANDEGVPWSQIAVVFWDVSDHAPALRAAFREAGIAAEFDLVTRACDTGWGRALLHLMRFAVDGSRADLLGFLRGSYSGVPRDDVDSLEASWRRRGVERPDMLRASLRSLGAGVAGLVDTIAQLMGAAGQESTGRTWKSLADGLMQNAHGQHAGELDPEGLLDASAHRAFMRLMSRAAGLRRFSPSGRELVEVFSDLRVTALSEGGAEAVQVLSAARARSRRFQVVIVGGLSAGDFPRIETENPLFRTGVTTVLSRHGIAMERKDERDLARLTFYLVASRATERLVLSRQVAASDGSPLRDSWILEEFLDLYRDPSVDEVPEDQLPPITTLRFEEQAVSANAPSSTRRALRTAALTGSGATDPHTSARLASASRRARPREPGLVDERVLAELRDRDVFSATEIESYLRCPYAWFRERVVRVEALEREPDAIELGRLCHDVLRRLFAGLHDQLGEARVTPANLTAVLAYADEVLAQVINGEGQSVSIDETAIRASARLRVRGFLRAEASFLPGFVPVSHEFAFDSDARLPGDFRLRGRIDRIDQGPGGVLVVTDYKTGQVGPSHAGVKFAETGLVQLALYARIAQTFLDAPVVGGLYRRVSAQNVAKCQNRGFFIDGSVAGPGLVSTDRMDQDQVAAVIEDAELRAGEAVSGMRAGHIAADPLDVKGCQRCGTRGLCGGVRR